MERKTLSRYEEVAKEMIGDFEAMIKNSAREDLALQSGLHDRDQDLRKEVYRIREKRKRSGFGELVGGLQCVIINTEPELQLAAVNELIRYSGLKLSEAFQDEQQRTYVFRVPGELRFRSPDILIRSLFGGGYGGIEAGGRGTHNQDIAVHRRRWAGG